MRIITPGRLSPLVGAVVAAGFVAGCGPDNPKIADAPPYEPPPFATAPPEFKGADGKSYQYGSNPDYQEAMQKMEASQGLGR